MGGYFIVNGNEKLIRQLILTRRHQIICLERPSFTKRGKDYSSFGVSLRCVRNDESSQSCVLHYKTDGTCVLGFSYRKSQYLVPAIILFRALGDWTDRQVFDEVVRGNSGNTFLVEKVTLMLSELRGNPLYSKRACLSYLGNRFRPVLNVPSSCSDQDVGAAFAGKLLFPHLDPANGQGKARLLAAMTRRLYSLVAGDSSADNADSTINHELLLPGHLYCNVVKENLQEFLYQLKKNVQTDERLGKTEVEFTDLKYLKKCIAKLPEIGKKLEYLMATGNLSSPSGLDLMQTSGFTIVADKLNFYRYVSHFRCVHRGAFFTTMKTTTVRKLLPDSWGFLCPVHTPDGTPCGLLNHMTASVVAVNNPVDVGAMPALLMSLGVIPPQHKATNAHIDVILNGELIGYILAGRAQQLADQLRMIKVNQYDARVPPTIEIALVLPSTRGQFPGLFLFTQLARMMRPVMNLRTNSEELVGSFEQAYMEIAVRPEEVISDQTTHMELKKTNFISVIANMTPFSDFNQSPRNMYVSLSQFYCLLALRSD